MYRSNFLIGFFFQCDTVLEIDPKNVKAYYRRGTSFFESGDPQSALEDFTKVKINTIRMFQTEEN